MDHPVSGPGCNVVKNMPFKREEISVGQMIATFLLEVPKIKMKHKHPQSEKTLEELE